VVALGLGCTAAAAQDVGVYQPTSGQFALRRSLSAGSADFVFRPPGTHSGQLPLAGDWNGDGRTDVGLYRPASRRFRLYDLSSSGSAAISFRLQGIRSGLVAIGGDWDGDGKDSAGVYDPARRIFHLKDEAAGGRADRTFVFEGAKKGWRPLAGDWNHDGVDGVGLYDPKTGTFYLRNDPGSSGPADLVARIESADTVRGWLPLTGDWNGDGTDTVGLYHPASGTFRLRNANSDGPSDLEFQLQGLRRGGRPLAGNWGSAAPASAAQTCVDAINRYRATLNRAPLARWTEAEGCGDDQARSDAASGQAHGAFGQCGESAQNECPNWPGPAETMIGGCLQMMWDEGPGSDYSKHGHYINMSNPGYSQVACGFYTKPDGRVWSVQDFR